MSWGAAPKTAASAGRARLVRDCRRALTGHSYALRNDLRLLRNAGFRGFDELSRAENQQTVESLSADEQATRDPFSPVWDEASLAMGRDLLRSVYEFLASINLHPVIFYGTLLGAARDGKVIPWDGDFDLAVDLRGRRTFVKALSALPSGIEVVPHFDYNYKFFPTDGVPTSAHFRWPWVDLDFYRVRGGRVKVLNVDGSTFYSCEVQEFFPHQSTSFEGISVATPNQVERHLDRMYPCWQTTYRSSSVDHRSAQTGATVVERSDSPPA